MGVLLSRTIPQYTAVIEILNLLVSFKETVNAMEHGLVPNPFADKKHVIVFPM
jgi:hypothetical protein